MPIYEYRHKEKAGKCKDPFEVIELNPDEMLEVCPECEKTVERIFSHFSSHKNILSDSNIKEKGFTKWVADGPGRMRKTV